LAVRRLSISTNYVNTSANKSAGRRALFKLALVLLLGVGAGVAMFLATLRYSPAGGGTAATAIDDLAALVDQQGAQFDPAVLKGRYVLIYFGFTMCPDACPTALYNQTLALAQLDADAQRIQPVFVSVDPARDSPEKIAGYLGHFSDRIIGLTGPESTVQLVLQGFGIIAVEHRDEAMPGGYTMDHSNEFLLFSPTGKLLMRLPAAQSSKELLEQVRGLTRAEAV
jgi:protein SCO1/2